MRIDMPPIASLILAMKKEKNEKIQKYNFVQKTIKENKDMVKTGKVLLAPLKHKENIFPDSVSPLVGDSSLCRDFILKSRIHGYLHVNKSEN